MKENGAGPRRRLELPQGTKGALPLEIADSLRREAGVTEEKKIPTRRQKVEPPALKDSSSRLG